MCILTLVALLPACGKIEKQETRPPETQSAGTAAEKSARLFEAVYNEDIGTLKDMLAAGVDIEGRDEEGYTPLLSAIVENCTEIAGFLIAAGADINAIYKEPEKKPEADEPSEPMMGIMGGGMPCNDGETALHVVAREGNVHLAQKLLRSGAKIDIKDAEGQIPLVEAVLRHNLEVVKLLVSRGASLSYRDKNGRTLLHIIANDRLLFILEEDELVEFLVARGISPNATDNNGRTPLHAAAESGTSEFAEFLLKNGANINLADGAGFTPLDLALKNDNSHCILLLHQHKGRTSREEPANIPEAVMMEDMERIRSFISGGKDVNEEYEYGKTALHYAAEKGRTDIAKLLISSGAHPDKRDNAGGTPFFDAVYYNHVHFCSLLLEHGADVDGKGWLVRTPLHQAVINGSLALCKLLVESGADPNKKDKAIRDYPGRTPLDWAIHEGHKEIEQLLRSHGARTAEELTPENK